MYSPKAWFYLILRISLLNGLTILVKYFYDLSAKSRRVELELETLKRENLVGKPVVVHLPSQQGKIQLFGETKFVRIPDFSRVRYIR